MPVREAAELQVLSADCELRAKVKAGVCLGNLLAGSGLVRLGWTPESGRPLLPGEPPTEPPQELKTQNGEGEGNFRGQGRKQDPEFMNLSSGYGASLLSLSTGRR